MLVNIGAALKQRIAHKEVITYILYTTYNVCNNRTCRYFKISEKDNLTISNLFNILHKTKH